MENEPSKLKSDDLLVSRGQSDRVEKAAPAQRLLPALSSCLWRNVQEVFICKHLLPVPLPKSIISKPETKAAATTHPPASSYSQRKLLKRSFWPSRFGKSNFMLSMRDLCTWTPPQALIRDESYPPPCAPDGSWPLSPVWHCLSISQRYTTDPLHHRF